MSDDTTLAAPAESDPEAPASVYEMIREDLISGRLEPSARLKVADLAERYGTSTNPVREALQQLRGEGFVLMEPNRGARVRPIDEAFVRDIIEIEVLIEPALTRWFVSIATDTDIVALEAAQAEIEALNFADAAQHGRLDTRLPSDHLRPALQPACRRALVEAPRDPARDRAALSDIAHAPSIGRRRASSAHRADQGAGRRWGGGGRRPACGRIGSPHHRADAGGEILTAGLAGRDNSQRGRGH
jgi:DNA-binding transcriptional regulator YhcF (GntR family)